MAIHILPRWGKEILLSKKTEKETKNENSATLMRKIESLFNISWTHYLHLILLDIKKQ